MGKVLPPDGEEGVLGIVVSPVGDQLSLCASCVDISLRLYPRESLFRSGFKDILSFMYYLYAIKDCTIFFGYSTSPVPLKTIIPSIPIIHYVNLQRHSISLRATSLPKLVFVTARNHPVVISLCLRLPNFELTCAISRIIIPHLFIL